MADILTQIQDELDKLLNQMQLSLTYIKNHAPPGNIPGQPLLSSIAEHEAQQQTQTTQPTQPSSAAHTQPSAQFSQSSHTTPEDFAKSVRELSQDLVLKEQQIELLIDRLPGIGTSERAQVERMRELEKQLEGIEEERMEAVREKRVLVERVEGLIRGVGGTG